MLELLKLLDKHPGGYGMILTAATVLIQLNTRAAVLKMYRAVSKEFIRREEFDNLTHRVDQIGEPASRRQHA